ncbi:hypothetical protein ASE17_19660 [Phenylobacterium sp. Root77]|jgi:hypothetical protein|uniref:DUF3606 domain-containing protein n=1 Tax=unclassified Phenylobacterium TaxID=2640670 RepID=UPI0006FB3B9B|nr:MULTISPECIES: DUF3606 domain-containing protein [unclassified Phenylobacterium]KQW67014.1 hypothetical protein ASC73_17945 [Phenylobacterium sp. Root1277]KQW89707.1 hypothetical protein ASC79_18850 [Phenylobacterium sp. Root1290]KRC43425.1 hypothetical protein ASE17_19660 [Phenylobacterium sp. Root77]
MRPDEPKSFDPHEPIDLRNPAKVREMTEKLDCSEDDLVEAVERVGPQPVAVAIFLGRSNALEIGA